MHNDNHFKQAARYNDAALEEHGDFKALVEERLDMSWDEVHHLCEQRALRLYAHQLGRWPTFLSAKDRVIVASYTALVLDGLLIGHEANEIARRV
jgi:hypothetical protein